MSYLVLARKYRPKSFAAMVGQEHVVQALTNALTTGRLHHAYMFTGTRGVGKTTVSRILAKSLNCTGADGQGGVTATPCGQCAACLDIDAGRFVDYTELDAASNRGVDEVQQLLEQAVYKPVQGRFKVFMIDEVHMLSNTAFNAMLKTLEEPPEYLKFVLATTDPQKVPVTVLSRCLQFNLRPMAPETVFAHLQHVLQQEQIEADSDALHLLSRAARGSMRDALSLTDQAIAYSAGLGGADGLHTAAVRQMLGSVDSSHVFRLIEALATSQPAQVLDVVQALQTHGLSAAHTLEEMARILQRMAVRQMVPQAPAASASDHPEEAEIQRLAPLLPPDETQLLYSLCLHGQQELGLAPDEYAALVMVLLRLLAFKPAQSAQSAAAPTSTSTHTPAPAEPAPTQPPAATGTSGETAQKKTPEHAATCHALTTGNAPQDVAAPPAPPSPPPQSLPSPRPPSVPTATQSPAPAVQTAQDTATAAHPAKDATTQPAPAEAPIAASIPPWEDIPPEPGSLPLAAALPVATADALALPVVAMRDPATRPPADDAPPPPPPLADEHTPQRRLLPTELGDLWHDLARQIVRQAQPTGYVRQLLIQSQLLAQTAASDESPVALWTLRVERENINHEPSRKKLEQLLADMGYPVHLLVEYGRVVDTPAMRQQQARQQQQQQAQAAFTAHPFVQAMMRDFAAQPLSGSVGFVTTEPDAPPPSPVNPL